MSTPGMNTENMRDTSASTLGLSVDSAWPRTGGWPAVPPIPANIDLALIGIPTALNSLSPSRAHETPRAVRDALRHYSSHVATPGFPGRRRGKQEIVLDEALTIVDAGDATNPDSEAGEERARQLVAQLATRADLVVAIGGDSSITVPAALGVFGDSIETAGLITLDAHHDLRDGRSNGSAVRRLIDAGLNPRRVVQIGIADFANSAEYRRRAHDLGITVIHRDELYTRPLHDVIDEALHIAGSGDGPLHVDLDLDVCDRSVAPACPAAMPGGIQAYDLRLAARLLATDPRVRGLDIAEVDATTDTPDGRTVHLAALCVLEAAAGLAKRLGH